MSLGDMWAEIAPEIGRTLGSTAEHPDRGERVVLRRASSLESGESTPAAFEIAAPAIMGASTVTLRLPSGAVLHGVLLAGARFVVGAVEYKLTADATAAGTTIAVTFSPVLAATVAADDPVTLHPEAVFTFEDCHVSRKLRRDLTRDLTADSMATIFVPARNAPTTPKLNDLLELEDGSRGRVANEVITKGAWWRLQMGG